MRCGFSWAIHAGRKASLSWAWRRNSRNYGTILHENVLFVTGIGGTRLRIERADCYNEPS
jgi:hypothetical protein